MTIHLDPINGSDLWAGESAADRLRRNGPVRTLQKALLLADEVRKAPGLLPEDEDIYINLGGHTVELTEPLRLQGIQCKESNPLVIARGTITNALRREDWTAAGEDRWKCECPEPPVAVWIDGTYAQPAASKVWRLAGQVPGQDGTAAVLTPEAAHGARPGQMSEVLHFWHAEQRPALKVAGARVDWGLKCSMPLTEAFSPAPLARMRWRYRPADLAPLTWGWEDGWLWVRTLPAKPPSEIRVAMPFPGAQGAPLVEMGASSYISWRKVEFRGGGLRHAPGERDGQSAVAPRRPRGEIRCGWQTWGIEFTECTHEGGAGYSFEAGPYARHTRWHRCASSNSGAGGWIVGDTDDREDQTYWTRKPDMDECTTLRWGQHAPNSTGFLCLKAWDATVSNCKAQDGHFTGFGQGWRWQYGAGQTLCNVSDCEARGIGAERLLNDLAGFYAVGPQSGSSIVRCRVEGVRRAAYGGRGFYLDNAAQDVSLKHLRAKAVEDHPFFQHFGKGTGIEWEDLMIEGEVYVQEPGK